MKHQYLVRACADQDYPDFERQIHADWLPLLQAQKPAALKVSYTAAKPPRMTVLPLIDRGLALFSVWGEADPTPQDWRAGRLAGGQLVEGYRVVDSIPRAYEKTWPDGQASPGVVVLTLLKRKQGLTDEAFMHEWHGRHTPKALRIHPLWNYIRNVIETAVTQNAAAFDGIVEEHFRSRADALNPIRMFGGPLKCLPNMLEVYRHVNQFLDLKGCENYLLTEKWIRN